MYGLDESKDYDVTAIGNAILDVLARADDDFLQSHDMVKGTMALIEAQQAMELYKQMGPAQEASGGSAANTLAGMARLGSKAAFIGKVYDDQFGETYRHDLTSVGVSFDTPTATKGKPTGRCYVIVTPDGERTMNTYLGAGSDIHESDIDESLINNSKIVFGEGYQWNGEENIKALNKAFALAKQSGGKVALTLSDVFVVEGNRDTFQTMLNNDGIDILFANEAEILALYPGKDLEEVIDEIHGKAEVIAITRSEQGSLIITKSERIEVPAEAVSNLVDTTGAGDLYAAGFLHGYCRGLPLAECGALGSQQAAKVIQQIGARLLD